MKYDNLVGGSEHLDYFSIQLGMSSSQLTNSIIFQRGRYTTNQLCSFDKIAVHWEANTPIFTRQIVKMVKYIIYITDSHQRNWPTYSSVLINHIPWDPSFSSYNLVLGQIAFTIKWLLNYKPKYDIVGETYLITSLILPWNGCWCGKWMELYSLSYLQLLHVYLSHYQ